MIHPAFTTRTQAVSQHLSAPQPQCSWRRQPADWLCVPSSCCKKIKTSYIYILIVDMFIVYHGLMAKWDFVPRTIWSNYSIYIYNLQSLSATVPPSPAHQCRTLDGSPMLPRAIFRPGWKRRPSCLRPLLTGETTHKHRRKNALVFPTIFIRWLIVTQSIMRFLRATVLTNSRKAP